jgi:hypothetical protein
MKPIMLVSPSIMLPPIDEALRLVKGNGLGEVDNRHIDSSWNVTPFFEHLRSCGYRPRDCKEFLPLALTFVNGACRWHTDPSYGIVACWLVHSENTLDSDAQLITRHGPLDMRTGDLCVFNSNYGHAWLSNAPCVMVMATVARIRPHQAS